MFNRTNAPGYSDEEIESLNQIFAAEVVADQVDENDEVACDRLRKYILDRLRDM